MKRCGQDGRVGRPELTSSLQNYNYLQNNYLWEQPKDDQKGFPTTKDVKKEPQGEG